MTTDVASPSDGPDFAKMGIYVDGRLKNELDELFKKSSSDVTARDSRQRFRMHYLIEQGAHASRRGIFGLATAARTAASR